MTDQTTEQASPGDTIVITSECEIQGENCLVIETPDDGKDGMFSDVPWVEFPGGDGMIMPLSFLEYSVVKRNDEPQKGRGNDRKNN